MCQTMLHSQKMGEKFSLGIIDQILSTQVLHDDQVYFPMSIWNFEVIGNSLAVAVLLSKQFLSSSLTFHTFLSSWIGLYVSCWDLKPINNVNKTIDVTLYDLIKRQYNSSRWLCQGESIKWDMESESKHLHRCYCNVEHLTHCLINGDPKCPQSLTFLAMYCLW